MAHYTIRYRATDRHGRTTLIVEDERGAAYLVCSGRLQARVATGAGDAPDQLAALLAPRAAWSRVPPVTPYTLDELRGLLDPAVDTPAQEVR